VAPTTLLTSKALLRLRLYLVDNALRRFLHFAGSLVDSAFVLKVLILRQNTNCFLRAAFDRVACSTHHVVLLQAVVRLRSAKKHRVSESTTHQKKNDQDDDQDACQAHSPRSVVFPAVSVKPATAEQQNQDYNQ
jgi:hypothetical protein